MNIYIWKDVPYLGFTARQSNSTITLNKKGNPPSTTFETSTDGTNWSDYTIGSAVTLSNVGDTVFWRNKSNSVMALASGNSDYYRFAMTGQIAASGDLGYMLCNESTDTIPNLGLYCLFVSCTSLVEAPQLPATSLGTSCYVALFSSTSITVPPQLPATSLGTSCYNGMFQNVTTLVGLPKLPATTLANSCYGYMFQGCTNIKLSTTQTGEYQTEYRIPTTGTGTDATDTMNMMINGTGGTFTGTPTINTTYYTSNTVV